MGLFEIIKTFEAKNQSNKIDLTDKSQNQEIELLSNRLYSESESLYDLRNLEKKQ